jgi:hypothetical protein
MQIESRTAQMLPPRHTPQSQSLSDEQNSVVQKGPRSEPSTQRWLAGQEIPLHEVTAQPWLSAPKAPVWQTELLGQV